MTGLFMAWMSGFIFARYVMFPVWHEQRNKREALARIERGDGVKAEHFDDCGQDGGCNPECKVRP